MSSPGIVSTVTGNTFNTQGDAVIQNTVFQNPVIQHTVTQNTFNISPDPLALLKPAERASYDTRYGAEDDQPHGCMENTRVQILADLEAWAHDPSAPNVHWLHGQLGTGKTTIAHTLCKRLDATKKLGGSFFCSRSGLTDARRIIPTISSMLARSNPNIRLSIHDVLANKPDVADLNDLFEQFRSLVANPVKIASEHEQGVNYIIVIEALDECLASGIVEMLIKAILDGVTNIPLKVFITSQPESWIKRPFLLHPVHPLNMAVFVATSLQEATQDVIQNDICTYLQNSLAEIAARDIFSMDLPEWPPAHEFTILLNLSAYLFIYAATAVRYIGAINEDNRTRLKEITRLGSTTLMQSPHTAPIDTLYQHIVDLAFPQPAGSGSPNRHDVLAAVVCVQTPLSMGHFASLLDLKKRDVQIALLPLQSVIHVTESSPVTIFHASFGEFIVSPARCCRHNVDASDTHHKLTVKCLQRMNKSLRYNICNLPHRATVTPAHEIPTPDLISETLRYSCLYWASHLVEALVLPPADTVPMLSELGTFASTHLLHWIECLSVLGELGSGLRSLSMVKEANSKFSKTDAHHALLLEDARRYLQMVIGLIEHRCLDTYGSALAWIPKQASIRYDYRTLFGNLPRVVVGIAESWGSFEHLMTHPDTVFSVAFSPEGTRIVSGCEDSSVRIWNAATGEIEHIMVGHPHTVGSVAFSPNGTQIVSGSNEGSIRIWNASTGEVEHILQGHSKLVSTVAFSSDGTSVVSGSYDTTARLWDATTGKMKGIQQFYSPVKCVAFSPDGKHVVSGLEDADICLWDATTGRVERILEGHSREVNSIACSSDGMRVVSGSDDCSVCIWNTDAWNLERILEGHSSWVNSVTFSPDGTRVVSGSSDRSVRIWHVASGETERVLKGHTSQVRCVAFSPDSTHVASAADDNSVRIWDVTRHPETVDRRSFSSDSASVFSASRARMEMKGKKYPALEGHSKMVTSVAFSPDGTRVVSGSEDMTVRVWNATTGKIEHVLEDHFGCVLSVAFSPDEKHIVSGSDDKSVILWKTATGKIKRKLEGHSNGVTSVSFSPDGRRVVSGCCDGPVWIWNASQGQVEHLLTGHSHQVTSFAFSYDGSRLVSGSMDHSVRIWNPTTGATERTLEGHSRGITSVAFSCDGTQVLSGSFDRSVRIWNIDTCDSIPVLEHESFQFPDGSRVTNYLPWRFHLFPPGEPQISISQARDWILTDLPLVSCWIPPQFRDFPTHAFSPSKVCFGYHSGHVVIVDLKPVH